MMPYKSKAHDKTAKNLLVSENLVKNGCNVVCNDHLKQSKGTYVE